MAIPFMEFQVWGYQINKVVCVPRKLQYIFKWNDGMVLKNGKF
jgi:hypothetical protein